jgi:hypothetical protein
MDEAQKHVDTIGLQTPPAFVARGMAVTPTIPPPYLLQVVLDVLRAGRVELDVLLRQVSEKMAGCIHTASHGSYSVLLCFQVILEFCKPHFVAGII